MDINVPRSSQEQDAACSRPPDLNPAGANAARMWNYWLGGTDNCAADRDAADKAQMAMPLMPLIARLARRFLRDAVRELAVGGGIRQFLDIGSGLPAADNTHEFAQRAAPESRTVYVDYDPVVRKYARPLLTSSPEGATGYVQADLCDPVTVLAGAARTLDLRQPIAILLIAVLHFIPDSDDPYEAVARLMDAVAPGSYLVIVHAANDIAAASAGQHARQCNGRSPSSITLRSRNQIVPFFDGLELTGRGLMPLTHWWQEGHLEAGPISGSSAYCGIARKP